MYMREMLIQWMFT